MGRSGCLSVKLKGTVKWFDTTKGFGFLLVDDNKGDVLLHANVLRNFGRGSVVEGTTVEFEVQDTDKGRQVSIIHSLDLPNELTRHLKMATSWVFQMCLALNWFRHESNGLINRRALVCQCLSIA